MPEDHGHFYDELGLRSSGADFPINKRISTKQIIATFTRIVHMELHNTLKTGIKLPWRFTT
jgi:hypothetical protein